jgi:excisionase family DNA binding protein
MSGEWTNRWDRDARPDDGVTRSGDEILTSREAREFLKIGRTKLWQLTRENVIPAYRVGTGKKASLRYKKSELLAWLDQNRI